MKRLMLAVLVLGPGLAQAQSLDLSSGGPVQVNAAGGIDWRQDDQVVIAHGDARATRGTVTVTAAELIAHYRKKAGAAQAHPAAKSDAPKPDAAKPADPTAPDAADGNEVYRLEADTGVHIFTATDQAFADKAVYDMDQSVLVLTGHALRLITPQDLLTATDSMEYWPSRHMAVARGHAVVLTNDARQMAADILVAYTTAGIPNAAPNPVQPVASRPADPLLASGKLQRVEAYGDVVVRTPTETVHGDRGVYLPDTGLARIVGHVRISRGQNQLNGAAADVDMKSGVASLLSGSQIGSHDRVQGLIVPNDTQGAAPANKAPRP